MTRSNGGRTLTITGTLAEVDADLQTLTDDNASAGLHTIRVHARDSFGNAAGETSIAVTVSRPPTLSIAHRTAVTSAKAAELPAGAADVLTASRHATLTGTGRADLFGFATPRSPLHPNSNVLVHFGAAADKIAFSDQGFHLELSGAGPQPELLPKGLFTANASGSFTNTKERFAYDTGTEELYYDARDESAGSSREVVATFAGHPHLTAGGVFFVS
jgi:hypothetical protein